MTIDTTQKFGYDAHSRKTKTTATFTEKLKKFGRHPIKSVKDAIKNLSASVLETSRNKSYEIEREKFSEALERIRNPYTSDKERDKIIDKTMANLRDTQAKYDQFIEENRETLSEQDIEDLKEEVKGLWDQLDEAIQSVRGYATDIEDTNVSEDAEIPEVSEVSEVSEPSFTFSTANQEELPEVPEAVSYELPETDQDYTETVQPNPIDMSEIFAAPLETESMPSAVEPEVEETDEIVTPEAQDISDLVENDDLEEETIPEVSEELEDLPEEEYTEEPKLEEELEVEETEKEDEQEEVIPTPIEKTSELDLRNLTQFDGYNDYVMEYRRQNIAFEDSDKFYTNLREGVLPPNMLTEEEFTDQKRRQVENIRYRALQHEDNERQKTLIETSNQLRAAQELVARLRAQVQEQKATLKSIREEKTSLEQTITDKNVETDTLKQENTDLTRQVSARDLSISEQQKQIFRLEKRLRQETADKKLERENKENLQEQLAQAEEREAAKDKIIADLTAEVNRFKANLHAELDKLTPDDSLEEVAINWTRQQIDNPRLPEDEKKIEGPRHLGEQKEKESTKRPKHLKESEELKAQRQHLVDTLNSLGMDPYEEEPTKGHTK